MPMQSKTAERESIDDVFPVGEVHDIVEANIDPVPNFRNDNDLYRYAFGLEKIGERVAIPVETDWKNLSNAFGLGISSPGRTTLICTIRSKTNMHFTYLNC
jgi:hypothetical protein